MKCPECSKEFEACPLCRAGERHQQCVDDDMCHDCLMKEKWGADYNLPKVSGNMCERSISDLERACLILIGEEQQKLNPNNSLISVLCDSVRLGREYCNHVEGK